MGEAKRRGNFETRQAQGIVKEFKKARDRAIRNAEYEASLTPEQKKKRSRTRALLTAVTGIAVAGNVTR